MKYLHYILLCLAFFASCSKETENGPDIPEGMTQVRINVPGYYNTGSLKPAATKAAPDATTLVGLEAHTLPIGATIWLSYAKSNGDGTYGEPDVKPYVVKSTNDYVGLYPCGIEEYTDAEGNEWLSINTAIDTDPLYLETGQTYKFKSMYPALDIQKADRKAFVHNGIWACINDPRYEQTGATVATMNVNRSRKITYLELKPMINQTARIHFEIEKGKNVHTIEMMHTGIEISGVENKGTVDQLDWTLEDFIEVRQMESLSEGEHWYKLQEFDVRNEKIIGDAYLLPLDVRRTYIFILINMAVNGIPTQYVLTLNGIILESSHSYDFNLKAGVDGNLTVVNWQNTSLTIKPNK